MPFSLSALSETLVICMFDHQISLQLLISLFYFLFCTFHLFCSILWETSSIWFSRPHWNTHFSLSYFLFLRAFFFFFLVSLVFVLSCFMVAVSYFSGICLVKIGFGFVFLTFSWSLFSASCFSLFTWFLYFLIEAFPRPR